jgi:hypothetical protein
MTNAVTSNDHFDAFISYFQQTGSDYAETIRDNLKRYSIKTFVAHIENHSYVRLGHNSMFSFCQLLLII